MPAPSDRLVPKIHPLSRTIEPEDPMELVAAPVPGDLELMLDSIIQEFAWLGLDPEQLLALFQSPAYPVLNQLRSHYGEEALRQRIQSFLGSSGMLRFRETIADDPEPEEDHEPELIQLSIRRVAGEPTP